MVLIDLETVSHGYEGLTLVINNAQGGLISVLVSDPINLTGLPACEHIYGDGDISMLFRASQFHIRRSIREWLDNHSDEVWYYVTLAAGTTLIVGGVAVAFTGGGIPVAVALITIGGSILVKVILAPPLRQRNMRYLHVGTMAPTIPNYDYGALQSGVKITKTTEGEVTVTVGKDGKITYFKVDSRDVVCLDAYNREVDSPGYIRNPDA